LTAFVRLFIVENLFSRRIVCTECQSDLNDSAKHCDRCDSNGEKKLAFIYDSDSRLVIRRILERCIPDIVVYRQRIVQGEQDQNNDIPFQRLYRSFASNVDHQPFISLVLHLDGIALSKSSKQTLWLLSGSIIELPPNLRYQRFNMPVLSMWVGYREPIIDLWMKSSIAQLKSLKSTGMSTPIVTVSVVH
jgi:Protein of unknown function (DUF1258)